MPSPSKKYLYLIVAAALLVPSAAFGASFTIDGVCVQGVACPLPSGSGDALSSGESESGFGPPSPSNVLTLGDGDTYSIAWTYSASFNAGGTNISFEPTVTYTGTSATTTADDITLDMFENYYTSGVGVNWNGAYTEDAALVLSGAGPGSSLTAQLCYDGTCLAALTQSGNGSSTKTNTQTLTGLTGNTLSAEYEFTFDFAPGTSSGSTGSSPPSIPEPAQTLPVGLALLSFACYHVVARRRSNAIGS
jgi:hypothetical protein